MSVCRRLLLLSSKDGGREAATLKGHTPTLLWQAGGRGGRAGREAKAVHGSRCDRALPDLYLTWLEAHGMHGMHGRLLLLID